jgi:hypothetical protein
MKKPTYKQLEQQLRSMTAQHPSAARSALSTLDTTSTEKCMGSGVILTITGLEGMELVSPVCIVDGLTPEAIASLKSEIRRSMATGRVNT